MPSTSPAVVASPNLLNAIGEINLACVSAAPDGLELENLRRRGIDILRIKWSAAEKPKNWFAFLGFARRNDARAAGFELCFVDGQLRYQFPVAGKSQSREISLAMDEISAVCLISADTQRRSHLRLTHQGRKFEIAEGLSDAALTWLRDRMVLEISGLTWKPLFNIGKRSTRLTANPDDEPYRRWTSSQGRLIALYLDQSAPKISELKSGLESKCAATARKATHWLKSSSAAVGAMQLSDLCQRLEIDLDSKDLTRAASLAPHLFAEFDKVTTAFRVALQGQTETGQNHHNEIDGDDEPNRQGPLFGVSALLVDDSKVNQEIARDCLLRSGCAVTLADDGEAAIAAHKETAFDIVLMDCQMSGLDGFATTRALREGEMRMGRPSAPVIALTANALRDDRQLCLAAGMNDYLSKPFVEGDLIEMIARWVKRENRQPQVAGASANKHPDDAAAA
jgi:CheY-like chemotaxis protein/HPt (histidine-containing phosphotransfer) domain-containing protein